MRRAPELRFPPRPGRGRLWIALGLSLALHAAAILLWTRVRPTGLVPGQQLIVVLPTADHASRTLPPYAPRVTPAPREPRGAPRGRPRSRSRPVAATPARTPAVADTSDLAVTAQTADARDTASGADAASGTLRPSLADSVLWVRPLPVTPRELREALAEGHAEKVDSAVTAILQAYLDSLAREPESRGMTLPSWVAKIGGKKFGVDQHNIYIAGIKIPAVVLALLPLPQGNIDQARAYNHLMDLRADLQYAAQRAATMEEFKEQIREIRERKEQERAFERAQRTRPDIPADSGGAP